MRLQLPHLLMVHGDLTHHLCAVHLRFEYILLHSLANLIVSSRILNQLVENGLVLAQDAECLLQVSKLEIVDLHSIGNADLDHIDFGLLCVSITISYLSTEPQFPWIGQFLRSADADVGKVAVGVSSKRLWAAYTELLVGELWIGQRSDLRRHLPRSLCFMI